MTDQSGEEQTLWEGESHNVTARATNGRLTLHYRLTTRHLYYETGGMVSRQEQVPLTDIKDVSVHQGLRDRTRNTGTVSVNYKQPDGSWCTARLNTIEEPARVRELINETVSRAKAAAPPEEGKARDRGTKPSAAPRPTSSRDAGWTASSAINNADQLVVLLNQLGALRDAGILSDEEFEAKKKEVLDRL